MYPSLLLHVGIARLTRSPKQTQCQMHEQHLNAIDGHGKLFGGTPALQLARSKFAVIAICNPR
jgi:hypothetical protein